MRKRLVLNFSLLLTVVALAVLIWRDPGQDTPPTAITALLPEQIQKISIDYSDAPSVKLVRTADQWQLTAPVQARAENTEVTPILNVAQSIPGRVYAAEEVNLAELGLEKPTQILTLNDIRISLGGRDALEDNRYAKVGDQVFLIPNPIETSLDPDYADLVAIELLPPGSQITRLDLPQASLTPTDQSGWRIEPGAQDLGADAAQYTIDAWSRARALWKNPADPEQTSTGQVEIKTAEGGTFKFDIIAREPQLILRAPGIGVDYHIAAHQAAPLLDLKHPDIEKPSNLKSASDVQLLTPETEE